MDYIITFDPRSGSTFLSKILTTKFNTVVLPESNFIYSIQKHKGSKESLVNKLLKEKKFKFYKINKKKLNEIISYSPFDKKKIIQSISKIATQRIYKKKNIKIGLKKTQIETTYELLDLFKNLRLVHLIRDPRNIHISKKKVFKKKGRLSSSIIVNTYMWVKILNKIEKIKKKFKDRFKIYSYEYIVKNNSGFEKNIKFFLKLNYSKEKKYFLPKSHKNIHQNLYKINFNTNTESYKDKLNFIEKFFFKLLCYNYLKKYGYEKKNNFFYQVTSIIFLNIIKLYSR